MSEETRAPQGNGKKQENQIDSTEDFVFFGAADKNGKGNIASTYPMFYYDVMGDNLRESIRRDKHAVENDLVPKGSLNEFKQALIDKEAKLRQFEMAVPKLSSKTKDRINRVREELGNEIRDRMFTYDQMQQTRGISYAQEEMRRMTEPCIKLTGDTLKAAHAANVRVTGGKVTRTGAEKVWKIASKLLGEELNVEALRR